ncbi:hypothetical protein BSL78_02637 [Apostichopus japonicus]|uniref:SAP domain-containing protein n=1 Tax=Stichopus japonicus TaxID=307972 RepID=A0A2G8LJM3_STIJA|nr:hypothetical protein BSL78_02637 [Apostichopus japonicus]
MPRSRRCRKLSVFDTNIEVTIGYHSGICLGIFLQDSDHAPSIFVQLPVNKETDHVIFPVARRMKNENDSNVAELEKLKVVDLRAKLSKLGISTSGRKAELIEKVRIYYLEQEEEAAAQEQDGGPPNLPPTPAQILQADQGMSGPPPLLHMEIPSPPPMSPEQLLVQEEMIEREKQRIFQQQQHVIQKRQEDQKRMEEEKMQKVLQQQQMLAVEELREQSMVSLPPAPPVPPHQIWMR